MKKSSLFSILCLVTTPVVYADSSTFFCDSELVEVTLDPSNLYYKVKFLSGKPRAIEGYATRETQENSAPVYEIGTDDHYLFRYSDRTPSEATIRTSLLYAEAKCLRR